MEADYPHNHDRIPEDILEEPPPYSNPPAAVADVNELPAYRDLGPRPPQVFPRRQSRSAANTPNSALDSQLRATSVYQRAAVEGNSNAFSSQAACPRRFSQIDTSDPNFCFPQEGDDPQTAMLREFARSKLYFDDSWDSRKGAVAGEPSEPPRLLSWMKRKLSSSRRGSEDLSVSEQSGAVEEQPVIDEETSRGDGDTARLA